MALYEDYHIVNYLQSVDYDNIKNIMMEIGDKDLFCFVNTDYSVYKQLIFNSLGFTSLTFQNVCQFFL